MGWDDIGTFSVQFHPRLQHFPFITANGEPFDYHKAILGLKTENKESQEERGLINSLIAEILENKYPNDFGEPTNNTMNQILQNPMYYKLLGENPAYFRRVEHAIENLDKKESIAFNKAYKTSR